jgi:hypothetical protein
MSALDCVVADCGNHTQKGTCKCNWLCDYGRFANIIDKYVAPLASYKIRQYVDGAIKATISGKVGTVEIWYGDSTANEVWVIERGTKVETYITGHWYAREPAKINMDYHTRKNHNPMTLHDALEKAFAVAQVQTKLPCSS